MNYSVYDLIRILLKKWYIVLLAMAVFAGAGLLMSHESFQYVTEEYEAHTALPETENREAKEDSIGLLQVSYLYSYKLPQEVVEMLDASGLLSGKGLSDLLEDDLVSILTRQDLQKTAPALAQKVISLSDISDMVEASALGWNTLRITIKDLTANDAQTLLATYLPNLVQVGAEVYNIDLVLSQTKSIFVSDNEQHHEEFATVVMQKPSSPPGIIRVGGTAAMLGFALSCMGILLYTFVKDTRPEKKK